MKKLVLLALIAMSLLIVSCSSDDSGDDSTNIPDPVAGAEGDGWNTFPAFTYSEPYIEWFNSTLNGQPSYDFVYPASSTQINSYKIDLRTAGFNVFATTSAPTFDERYVKRVNNTDYIVAIKTNTSGNISYSVQTLVWPSSENVSVSPATARTGVQTTFTVTKPSPACSTSVSTFYQNLPIISGTYPNLTLTTTTGGTGYYYWVITCGERKYSIRTTVQ